MKSPRIILIALAVCAVLGIATASFMTKSGNKSAEPAVQQETAQTAAEAAPAVPPLMIGDVAVDPLCFINPSAESFPQSYPVTNCGKGDVIEDSEGEKNPMGDQFLAKSYKYTGDDTLRGAIGYRYIGDVEGHKALWIIENMGGTGFFTSLVLLDHDETGEHLNLYKLLATGDRCNGGIAEAQVVDGKLFYERDVTPYDIMALTGASDRPILQSEAAGKLPSCAICCYARAQYDSETLKGLQLDLRLPQAIASKSYTDESSPEKCFDELVKLTVESGAGHFDIPELESFTREIEHVCLGRPEGE